MRPASAIDRRRNWCGAALISLTIAASGACHHSARNAGAPLPADTLDNGYTPSVGEHPMGAVRSLGPEEIAHLRVRRVEELLAGRVPGLRVLPTADGGFTVRVRGIAALNGHAEPLYVIDGVPVTLLPGEGLSWLDPADILRIDVLKDPTETSIYGVRGANGVIVIRTKGTLRRRDR
jgi:TonB-dependent SusC/RagA subfamily outer membrane receptor